MSLIDGINNFNNYEMFATQASISTPKVGQGQQPKVNPFQSGEQQVFGQAWKGFEAKKWDANSSGIGVGALGEGNGVASRLPNGQETISGEKLNLKF